MSTAYTPAADRYETLPYVRCGHSGLTLPRLALGLWHNFGHDADPANRRAMVCTAFDRGITHFDLANNYGPPPGAAEENFGRLLREDLGGYRDEMIIATKAGYRMGPGPYGDGGSRKYLLSSLDQSLRRMRLDYVDIFYHHRRDPATPLEETMGALADAVRSGRALYVGVSNYDAASTRAAAAILRDLGVPLLIHQPVYNMLKRDVEAELLPALGELGVGCIPFSPLAQGLLSERYLRDIPADSRAAGPSIFLSADRITPELRGRLQALAAIAAARGVSLAQLAVLWLWRRPEITTVLIGASRPAQIEDLCAATAQPPLSAGELAQIEALLA
jgi:L-glyceraldehyde 3-phosphate reductase